MGEKYIYIQKKRKETNKQKKTNHPQFAHSTLGKICLWILVIYREMCESRFATALKLYTVKQNPVLNALGAAFLSFENSYQFCQFYLRKK